MRILSSTRRRRGRPNRALARRAGATLVELMIAILLLAVGLLAVAGVSVVVMAQVTNASNQTIAASVIQSRFEPLERRSCTAVVAGSDTYRGIEETWETAAIGARVRSVRDSLRFSGFRGRKSLTVGTVVSCVQ